MNDAEKLLRDCGYEKNIYACTDDEIAIFEKDMSNEEFYDKGDIFQIVFSKHKEVEKMLYNKKYAQHNIVAMTYCEIKACAYFLDANNLG